jgi:hypothetical protein
MMTKEKEQTIAEVVNDIKATAWNKAIAPRAESVLSYLRNEQWQKGVGAYLKSCEQQLEKRLLNGCKSRDDDQLVRGQLIMLKEILALPEMIESVVEAKKNPPAAPTEYTA